MAGAHPGEIRLRLLSCPCPSASLGPWLRYTMGSPCQWRGQHTEPHWKWQWHYSLAEAIPETLYINSQSYPFRWFLCPALSCQEASAVVAQAWAVKSQKPRKIHTTVRDAPSQGDQNENCWKRMEEAGEGKVGQKQRASWRYMVLTAPERSWDHSMSPSSWSAHSALEVCSGYQVVVWTKVQQPVLSPLHKVVFSLGCVISGMLTARSILLIC